MRYEALLLRHAKFSDNHHLKVSREEWSTFAKDALHDGFYNIASKAFAYATAHTHRSQLDSTNSIEKDKINDMTGLQNLAKSLSAKHSVQSESAEYMKRRNSGVHEKYNLQSGKPKLPGSSMYMLGIKTRNIKKLLHSRERNLGDIWSNLSMASSTRLTIMTIICSRSHFVKGENFCNGDMKWSSCMSLWFKL